MAIEATGMKVDYKQSPEPIPKELTIMFQKNPDLALAFKSLTPGKQRGYIIHFSQPKKSETRIGRIEKCIPNILRGKGIHHDYRSKKKDQNPWAPGKSHEKVRKNAIDSFNLLEYD